MQTPSLMQNIGLKIDALLARYASGDVNAAEVLCDSHPADALAYRIIAEDLSIDDMTYGDLRAESERFAAALASLGVAQGDRVATLMGKSRRYLVSLVAIWRLGAVHVPLFTAFAPSAIAMRLAGSHAKVVVCDGNQRSKLEPGDDIPVDAAWSIVTTGAPDDRAISFDAFMADFKPGLASVAAGGDAPFIHIFTSGTSGTPKGVIVPLRALAAFQSYAEYGLGLQDGDVYWCAADPGWAYGLYFGVLATFTTGVRSILFEGKFTPEATMQILEREQVTNFAAAPTVYRAIRGAQLPMPTNLKLRCASSAGEPLTPDVNEWATKALGVEVHDHYGQTETGMIINNHHHAVMKQPIKVGAMGKALPGWSAAILRDDEDVPAMIGETGRVVMDLSQSPLAFFSGYDGDPSKTAERFSADGKWYLTGDTGSVDADGYFRFSARDDDVIIMAGYRIGPFEVESTMAMHDAVAEAAVIAVPDTVRGEVMEAYVVLAPGCTGTELLEKDLQNWVKTRYAAHAFPRAVHFIQAMPKTPSGKIKRFVLKQKRIAELQGNSMLT